jgi:2,4-dienoyl-CoA reductase-like NADH-dependent reductase (Old Yellow Enzyme family)
MKLFDEINIAGMNLSNRLVRSSAYEKRADDDGFVTDSMLRHYGRLADGGVGLIITGGALVHPSGRSLKRMLCAHSDSYMPGLTQLAEHVHKRDGKIALALTHGGRECTSLLLGGDDPLAPSAVRNHINDTMPRAMSDSDIWSMVESFARAAFRAEASGFDALQLDASFGSLAHSFLSPYTNLRDDYWGGDEERRFHFIEEVLTASRNEVSAGYPIIVKINVNDHIPGGLEIDEALRIGQRLVNASADMLELTGGMRESSQLPPDSDVHYRDEGARFKSALTVPIILTGGIRARAQMDDVLLNEQADLLGLGRPLLREPDLPAKLSSGKEQADCISCDGCKKYSRKKTVQCSELTT